MPSGSARSASKTSVQDGSITNSKKTMCNGRSKSGQSPAMTGMIERPTIGTWTEMMNTTALRMFA